MIYQNWDRYICMTSDCVIVEKYVSKHVNLVISGAVKTLVECNWVTSVQRCQHWDREPKMAPILWSILSRQVQDNSDWSENLTGLMTIFTDTVGWSIINTSRTIFMLLVLWFGVFFIEKSSRESVEAISGLAVFDRFYQDAGRKSACVNDVQSPRAA